MPTPVNDETATIDTTPKALENKEDVIYPQKRKADPPSEIDTTQTKKLYGQQDNQTAPKTNAKGRYALSLLRRCHTQEGS